MKKPLVTIICTCFNHETFVKESVGSALHQTYRPLEVIIVDDNSTDNSVEVIHQLIKDNPEIKFIANTNNLGICKSFNNAFAQSSGEYVIDLAADDVLLPNRVEKGIESFLKSPKAGVDFCDALYINEFSDIIKPHHKRDKKGNLLEEIPQGLIYKDILERYFICPPTMMYARKVLEFLGGYDEELAYEDFDFQVRSSRVFPYSFTNEILVKKRLLKSSLSVTQYKPNSRILRSTYKICEKALLLNQTPEEFEALKTRIFYELRQAVLSRNFSIAHQFLSLLDRMKVKNLQVWMYRIILQVVIKRK